MHTKYECFKNDIDDTTELNVKNESDKRAELKEKARDKMAEQEAREGYSGNELLDRIRNDAKTTNQKFNDRYGKGKR